MALARLDHTIEAVQRNCHVTDARHARGMTLCTYLLEMREFFRWEHGIALGEAPPRSEVGPWLSAREALWETLEDAGFEPIPLGDDSFDPFDSAAINARLLPEGYLYGAGIGRFHKPHFFLGRLRDKVSPASTAAVQGAAQVRVVGCEYARDLTAIPAALQRDTIVVRQEALRQWLWEKAEAWQLKRQPGAMQAALAAYGWFDDAAGAIERMTEGETDTLILHEQGEFAVGQQLGDAWEALLAGLRKKRAEILLRAIRDNWADCIRTLPQLVERAEAGGGDASLHFWFSNFDGMRRALFPALVEAYAQWGAGRREAMRDLAARGRAHWAGVAGDILQRAAAGHAIEDELERLSHDLAPVAL